MTPDDSSMQRPELTLPERENLAELPYYSGSIPMRGPPAPVRLSSDCMGSTVYPPATESVTVNAAVHRGHRNLPTGLRPNGIEASPKEFFQGGIVWACYMTTALDNNADPLRNRDFVWTHISLASCKRRLFFVDYAHDRDGLQAWPIFTHGGHGLERVPRRSHKHHVPILDSHDQTSNPQHRYYKEVRAQLYGRNTVKPNSYIDISISYPLHFREKIDRAGYTSEEHAKYVVEMADKLRTHGRQATAQYATRERESGQ